MKRNFAFTATSIASRLLVSTLLFLLLARVWGPGVFGTFTYVFSVCALLMLTVDFGFGAFLLREIGANPDEATNLIAQGFRAKLVLAGFMTLCATVLGIALGPNDLPPTLFILLTVSALTLSFAENCIAPLRALGRYDRETAVVTANNIVQFLLPGSVALAGGSPVAVASSIVVARVLYLLSAWRMLRRTVPRLKIRSATGSVWDTLRRVWPYGVDGALNTSWSFVDVVAVRTIFGPHIVGLYAAGQKCVQGAGALAPVVGNVMVPRLARSAAQRASDTWRLATLTGTLMATTGVVLALPLIFLPEWIVHIAFGSEYSELAEWLPLFGVVLLLRYLSAAVGVILTAIGLQKKRIAGQLLAVFLYLGSMYVVSVNGFAVDSALVALILATAAMGGVYAVHLTIARRRNVIGAPEVND